MKFIYIINFLVYNRASTEILIYSEEKTKDELEVEIRKDTHDTAVILHALEYSVEVKKERRVA